MQRPDLRGRLPDPLASRLPGGDSDADDDPTEPTIDDVTVQASDGGDSDSGSRLPTLLTVAGLGLAAVGVGLRYLQGRGDESSTDTPRADAGLPGSDEDVAGGTVEIVGEADAEAGETDPEAGETDPEAGESAASASESEAAASTDDTGDVEAESGTAAGTTIRTFEADRTTDADEQRGTEADGTTRDETTREGPPRIAPLVGMAALVAMRLVVERVRKRSA
ncbi:hypothetical protein [Halorientalis halophila]|uniref:hypothetical protein n=1 Tax=Halorientalis halophila TaxID=3108499 RepID=UPI003008983E